MNEVKPTRAAAGAPPKKAAPVTFIPAEEAEKPAEAADNMDGARPVGMTFNMPLEWHLEFKLAAASQRKPMSKFLVDCFNAWKREQKRK